MYKVATMENSHAIIGDKTASLSKRLNDLMICLEVFTCAKSVFAHDVWIFT
jgi:hypothetical protein